MEGGNMSHLYPCPKCSSLLPYERQNCINCGAALEPAFEVCDADEIFYLEIEKICQKHAGEYREEDWDE
jgi:hypothetical protein